MSKKKNRKDPIYNEGLNINSGKLSMHLLMFIDRNISSRTTIFMSNADFDNSVLPILTEHFAYVDKLDTSEYTGSTAMGSAAPKTPDNPRYETSILKSNQTETVLKTIPNGT